MEEQNLVLDEYGDTDDRPGRVDVACRFPALRWSD
jgi:hypothetical protein